jgi:hypothetical protein
MAIIGMEQFRRWEKEHEENAEADGILLHVR